MVDENQFEYNDLTFGAGTELGVISESGIGGHQLKVEEVPKPGQVGSWFRSGPKKAKHIILTGNCVPTAMALWPTLQSTLDAAFAERDDAIPLYFNYGDGEQYILCKPGEDAVSYRRDIIAASRGVLQLWEVELVAEDPTIYDGGPS